MKLNIKHMIAAFTFLGMVGCDKNFEEFDIVGEELRQPLNFRLSYRRLYRGR